MADNVVFFVGGTCIALVIIAIAFTVRRSFSTPAAHALERPDDIFTRFKQEAALSPKDSTIQMNWGNALLVRAGTFKNTSDKLLMYKEAAERFRRATELSPSLATTWKALGRTLYLLFRLERCEDRGAFAAAWAAYESAVRLSPLDASVWQQWGEDLYMAAAHCAEEERKEELVNMAKTRYAQAVAINPGYMDAWKSWGGGSAALEEIQAATGDLRGQAFDELGEDGDRLLPGMPGTRPVSEKDEGGAMPWELETTMDEPEDYFSACNGGEVKNEQATPEGNQRAQEGRVQEK